MSRRSYPWWRPGRGPWRAEDESCEGPDVVPSHLPVGDDFRPRPGLEEMRCASAVGGDSPSVGDRGCPVGDAGGGGVEHREARVPSVPAVLCLQAISVLSGESDGNAPLDAMADARRVVRSPLIRQVSPPLPRAA